MSVVVGDTFIQTLTANTSAGTGSFTTGAFGLTTKSGNSIIMSIADDSGAINNITSITSSAGGNAGVQALSVASTEGFSIWCISDITGAASNTLTVNYNSVAITNVSVTAQEFRGVLQAAPLDKFASATGTSAVPNSGASAITTRDKELIIGGVGYAAAGAAATLGAGYSNLGNEVTNVTLHTAQQHKVVGAAAAQTATFAITSAVWLCGVATFYGSFPSIRQPILRPHPFKPGLPR